MEEDKKKIEGTKEKRILSLKHLSINKRKRTNLEVAKINPKDALISNLRKAATSEGITWKTLVSILFPFIYFTFHATSLCFLSEFKKFILKAVNTIQITNKMKG